MEIKNSDIKVISASYNQKEFDQSFDGFDAIFATERTDFGGYSHFFTQDLFSAITGTQSGINDFVHIKNIDAINLQKSNKPHLIHTQIIKNSLQESTELMNNIIRISRDKGFDKILLTQFIKLKTNDNENFKGCLLSFRQDVGKSKITIFFAVDKDHHNEFKAILDNSSNNID